MTNEWLYYFLSSKVVQDRIITLSTRVRQSGVRPEDLDNLDIALPSMDVQKEVVQKIQEEHKKIDTIKDLMKIFEEKIKLKIMEVWGEAL